MLDLIIVKIIKNQNYSFQNYSLTGSTVFMNKSVGVMFMRPDYLLTEHRQY